MSKKEVYEIVIAGRDPLTVPAMSSPVVCNRCGTQFKYNTLSSASIRFRTSATEPRTTERYILCPLGRTERNDGDCARASGGHKIDTYLDPTGHRPSFYDIVKAGVCKDNVGSPALMLGPFTCQSRACVFNFNKARVQ